MIRGLAPGPGLSADSLIYSRSSHFLAASKRFSSWPTVACQNPTLTMMANAVRISEAMIAAEKG